MRIIIKLLEAAGFKFNIMQWRFGRKILGGTFYYIGNVRLPMGCFWSDKIITSCGAKVINFEVWPALDKTRSINYE